ncbi:putative stress-induced transcription regulator [Murinocardiopsis flavida]|uniref:Putative stress-induced transcription regulator n=1 Tax=Murinocardiopsis flavida TaxID=645275 RepID=A0A2P8CR64_9ACTN|nr:CGNR zinc finger domain-containing protein [Murinocardiopsis flavida]PSK87453.1 putative stress-induced transcription regulator [Murinocardiopsis flavida]
MSSKNRRTDDPRKGEGAKRGGHTRHSVQDNAQRTAALVNVLTGGSPPAPADVADVLRDHGETGPVDVSPADVAELRIAAEALRGVFAAPDLAEAVTCLNRLLAEGTGPVRLSAHGGDTPWHIHLDSGDEAPWAEWFLASSCMALAVLIWDRQRPPGGVCAARRCTNVYVEGGSGAPRRYCSGRCATRERVATHRRSRLVRDDG